jgi:ParB/RepB/Spo0J family partition protein
MSEETNNHEGGNSEREVCQIRVSKILVLPSHKDLDDKIVDLIAESYEVHGQISPILVRRVSQKEDGQDVTKIVLVAGAHRLAATKSRGEKYIDCIFVETDELTTKLLALGENIWRKRLNALDYAEQLTEYLQIASKRFNVAGEGIERRRRGRPRLEIPLFGRNGDARRKWIERAKKIARIAPEAKKIARLSGLARLQKPLLEIARATTPKAQTNKATELADRLQAVTRSKQARSAAPSSNAAVERQGDSNETEEAIPGDQTQERPEDTSLETLLAMWAREGRKLWAYAPLAVRRKFHKRLLCAPCKAHVDYIAFLKDAFRGRGRLGIQEVHCLARQRGLSSKWLSQARRALGYKSKRENRDPRSWRYYVNHNLDWKEELKVIKDEEFRAAVLAEARLKEQKDPDLPRDREVAELIGIVK